MITAILAAWAETVKLALRVWDYLSGRPRERLEQERIRLEDVSRQAQITGDLVGLRRARAQIEEVDRKLRTGDY
jgi:DNA polymerase/3'-5' exonuclease PolX